MIRLVGTFLLCLISISIFAENMSSSFFLVSLKGNNLKKILSEKKSIFRLCSGVSDLSLPETKFQSILGAESYKKKSCLKIACGYPVKNDFSDKLLDEMVKRYTINTPILNYKSPMVNLLATQAGKQKNILKSIPIFVYNFISNKESGIPFSSADVIIKTRSGDCTEHAVLTAALFRANNIPCRALVGVIFSDKWSQFPEKKNVFIYHMWNEIFFNGKWHLVDSTRPGDINPNRYIAFTYHSLKSETPLSYLEAVSQIKNLKVEYLNEQK